MVARSRSRAQGAFIALGLALVVALAFSSSIDAARVPVTTSTEAIKSFHAQLQSSTAFLESAEASAIAAKRADEMKTLMMSDAATALAHADELHSFLSKSSSSASHLQLESAFSGTADVELLCPWGAPTDSVPKHEGGCTCWNSITLHAAEGKKTYRSLLPEDHPLAGYPKYGVHVTGYSLEDVAVIHPTAPTHHLESISHSDAQHNFQSKACTTNAKIQSRTGVKNLLFINVDFPDKPGFPRTKDQLLALGQEIDAYYRATSFGKTNVVTSVAAMTNTLRMPRNTATYIAGTGYSLLRQDAEQAANAAGIEVCAYEMEVINFAQIAYQWAGLGAVGAKPAWINGYFDLRVTGHELGHNYGLPHAAFWRTGTTEPLAPGGTSLEYGDTYDVMGGQGTAKGHVNIIFKAKLSWITENVNTKNIPTTDTLPNGFTGLIGPMDLAGYGGATLAGVSVQRTNEIPAGYAFWLSTRSLFPEAIGQLNFHTEIREYAIPGSYLLDLHGETASLADSGLYPGESYSDCGQKIHITNAGMQPCPASTAANPIYCVNAVVKKGDNPNNTPFKLTVSPKTATAGQPVTFTAASDATYFSWRVDNVAASGASFTYNMPAAQNNVYKKVTVILADGLGRRARYAYALAVGNPAGAAPDYTADMYRYSCATGRQAGYAPAPMDGGANVPTTPQPVSYAWVAKQFSDCSTRVANPNDQSKWCGGGTASRSVTCTDAAGQPVGDNMCSAAGAKPADKLPCDTNACSTYQWATTEFSMCSLPCGGGVQTRSVTCQTATSSNADVPLGAVVDEVNCKDSKPSSTAACNTQACATFGWVAAAYGECSKSCGGGVQTRDVVCKSSASAGVVPVNTPFRLTNRQSGNYLAVSGNSQTAAAMTASSTIAASSSTFTLAPTPTTSQVYIQTTHITNIAQLVVTSTAAGVATATKGTDATQFFSFTDKGDGYFQIISSGQALDVTGAGAVIRAAPSASTSQLWRFARVDGQPISQSAVVADSNCNMAGSKPDAQQTCNTAACGQYSWLLGTFGQCQCATGATDGTQTRTVSCQDSTSQAAAADAQCPAPKPSVSQSCQCSSCTQDCNTPYGFCSMVDNQPTCKCAAGVGGDDCKSLPTVSNVKVSQVGVPDSATSVKAGDSVVVSWTVIGGATAQITGVNILLWHPNGIAPGYVARNVPNTGSYLWLVNVDHLEGPHYVEVSLIGVDQIVKTAKAQSGTFPIIDPCKVLGINCQHGKCSLGVCACESGWTGNACNTPQQCFDAGRTCNGHGDCSLVGSNQPFCNCTDGYTNGPAGNCERKTGCGMTCVRGAPDDTCQSCVCPAGSFYTSRDMCSTCGLTCNGRGTVNSACSACTCQAGYGGLNCNQQVSAYTVRVFLSGSGELTDEQKGAFAKLVIADLTSLLNKPGQTPIRVQTANSDPAASITKDPSVASSVYWFKFQVWQQLSAEVAPVDQPTPTTPPGQVVGQTIDVLAVMRAAFNDAKSEFFSGVSASMLDTTSLAIDTSTPPPATRSPNQQAGSASSVHAQSFTFFVTLLAVAAAAARRA